MLDFARMKTMKYIAVLTLLITGLSAQAARNVKCKVYQEFVNESRVQKAQPKDLNLDQENQSKSAYLKTVVSNLDAKLTDRGVLVALKNGQGNHQKLLRFKKDNTLSQTLEYPSDRPNGISNRVRLDCLQSR